MAARKQTPKKIEPEVTEEQEKPEAPEATAPNGSKPAGSGTNADIVLETEEPSPWQTVNDLSDNILTVQCVNMVDKTGMGRRNCLMRMVNAKTGELTGIPAVMKGFLVVNGDLQGE